MHARTEVVVPYAIILLSGGEEQEIPSYVDGLLITSTPTCIAVGCRAAVDGTTALTLGDLDEVTLDREAMHYGALETPMRLVRLQTVDGHDVLEMPVRSEKTSVTIWANSPTEPDEIVFGLE